MAGNTGIFGRPTRAKMLNNKFIDGTSPDTLRQTPDSPCSGILKGRNSGNLRKGIKSATNNVPDIDETSIRMENMEGELVSVKDTIEKIYDLISRQTSEAEGRDEGGESTSRDLEGIASLNRDLTQLNNRVEAFMDEVRALLTGGQAKTSGSDAIVMPAVTEERGPNGEEGRPQDQLNEFEREYARVTMAVTENPEARIPNSNRRSEQ